MPSSIARIAGSPMDAIIGPGLDIHILMTTPPGSQGIILSDHPETEDGDNHSHSSHRSQSRNLSTDSPLHGFSRDLPQRDSRSLPIPGRIITPDLSALPGKFLHLGWSLPLPPSPMRNIWTTLTPQVLLTPFWTPL